jgi:hypothetical protein
VHANRISPRVGPLDADELDLIRAQIEEFDEIDQVVPELRGIVARNWPHLLAKLPPENESD